MLITKEDTKKIISYLGEIVKENNTIADRDCIPEFQNETDSISVHAMKIARMIDPLGTLKVTAAACGYELPDGEE